MVKLQEEANNNDENKVGMFPQQEWPKVPWECT